MDRTNRVSRDITDVAEKVRAACIEAAQEGFQEASMSGLCMEGIGGRIHTVTQP